MTHTENLPRRGLPTLTGLALAAALAFLPGLARADQADGRPLLSQTFAPRTVNQIDIGDFHFVPGQPAPVHTHVAPVFGYVSVGAINFQVEGQRPHLLKAGDAFYEPVGPRILHFDNASKTDEAVFTDINLQRTGEPFIVFPAPPTEKIDRRAFPTPTLDGATVSAVTVTAQTLAPAAVAEQTPADSTVFYVAGGDVSLQFQGEWAVVYHAGETFFEPKGKAVARLTNTSGDKPVRLIAFHLLNPPTGQ